MYSFERLNIFGKWFASNLYLNFSFEKQCSNYFYPFLCQDMTGKHATLLGILLLLALCRSLLAVYEKIRDHLNKTLAYILEPEFSYLYIE